MVGGIETRTFENDLGGGYDFSQFFLAAFGAGLQGFIVKGLMFFELDTACITSIGINRHFFLLTRKYS